MSTLLATNSDAQTAEAVVRKFSGRIEPGDRTYRIRHGLGTRDVMVQTRIAGRVREGGIVIVDENTIEIGFGGTLNEPMEVVILG